MKLHIFSQWPHMVSWACCCGILLLTMERWNAVATSTPRSFWESSAWHGEGPSYYSKFLNLKTLGSMPEFINHRRRELDRTGLTLELVLDRGVRWLMGGMLCQKCHVYTCLTISDGCFLASETLLLWVASSISICPILAMSALQGIWPHSYRS